jgi:hypothetical protein
LFANALAVATCLISAPLYFLGGEYGVNSVFSDGPEKMNRHQLSDPVNPIDVRTFTGHITWAKVTRITGQTVELDASSPGPE